MSQVLSSKIEFALIARFQTAESLGGIKARIHAVRIVVQELKTVMPMYVAYVAMNCTEGPLDLVLFKDSCTLPPQMAMLLYRSKDEFSCFFKFS